MNSIIFILGLVFIGEIVIKLFAMRLQKNQSKVTFSKVEDESAVPKQLHRNLLKRLLNAVAIQIIVFGIIAMIGPLTWPVGVWIAAVLVMNIPDVIEYWWLEYKIMKHGGLANLPLTPVQAQMVASAKDWTSMLQNKTSLESVIKEIATKKISAKGTPASEIEDYAKYINATDETAITAAPISEDEKSFLIALNQDQAIDWVDGANYLLIEEVPAFVTQVRPLYMMWKQARTK